MLDWYDDSEEMEDAEDIIASEVEGEGGDYKYTSISETALFRATKSNAVNNEHSLPWCVLLQENTQLEDAPQTWRKFRAIKENYVNKWCAL